MNGSPFTGDFLCSQVTEIPQAECDALAALYNSANGAGWIDHTNWLMTNTPSNWYGVTVSGGHVVKLDLNSNQLIGIIPAQIGEMAYLQELYLADNELNNSIPATLGSLINLKTLNLADNQLSGSIPT